jgi:hypothetical protein
MAGRSPLFARAQRESAGSIMRNVEPPLPDQLRGAGHNRPLVVEASRYE